VEQELSLSLKPSKEMPWRMKITDGDGHIYWFDSQFYLRQGKSINSDSDEFKYIFSNNYAQKIRTLSQAEINRFYRIRVFPWGKRQEYEDGDIPFEDLQVLPRTDPNSDTTGTLLTYGIILGNYTTSETLQLQAQAQGGGTSQTLGRRVGKGARPARTASNRTRRPPWPRRLPRKPPEKKRPLQIPPKALESESRSLEDRT
jgi:hypothetical protein